MKPRKIVLDGGSMLIAIETDKFKTEMLTVTMPLPLEQRTSRLCNLLFSTLKRGCRKYPDIASLSRHLDDLYDANIATMVTPTGENISAGFVCECLDSAYVKSGEDLLDGTLETLSEMLFSPLFTAEGIFFENTVEREKRNLCDSIRASDNDPRIHSFQLCRGMMFKGEPYGLRSSGTVEDIMAVSARELTDFHSEYLYSSLPVYIYVGRRDAENVGKLISRHFSSFGGSLTRLNDTIVKSASPTMRSIEEDMRVLQGKLTIGFRSDIGTTDDDVYASIVFNDIFGGSPSSKLFRNVREKMSLCYSCSSSLNFVKGALFVRSGISNENKDKVIGEVLSQFEEIKKGNVSDYELECSKKSIENYYRQVSDSAYGLESFYRTRQLAGIDVSVDEAIEKLREVTREDVVRVANRFGIDTCAFVRGTLSGEDDGEGADYDE